MFFRRQSPVLPTLSWAKSGSFSKIKDPQHNPNTYPQLRYTIFLSLFLSLWFLVFLFWFQPSNTEPTQLPSNDHKTSPIPTCNDAVSVYVYDLPTHFNLGMLLRCQHLNVYTNMCPHVANCGLGQPLPGHSASWFATHQFIAEMIFHARVENHPCRTWDPNKANLFYVPFYGGLYASSMFRESNHTIRDSLAVDLVNYLQSQPSWQRSSGRDHIIALGRTAWDFMRDNSVPDFGANILLNLPRVQNMSVLTVERQPWKGSNQYGIPYPSYFHPSTVTEMVRWQLLMKQSERPYLFSFIGGERKGLDKAAIRNDIVKQCANTTRCMLFKCGSGASKCHEPTEVLKVMTKSVFCLQAPGDSFTRRSTFDAVVSGCIPVFFSPHTAYTQYAWYFPEDTERYSVYIDEKGDGSNRIEEELLKISREKVERMREVVINLIPRITYSHPNASNAGFKDAVDVALIQLSRLVQTNVKNSDKEVPTGLLHNI